MLIVGLADRGVLEEKSFSYLLLALLVAVGVVALRVSRNRQRHLHIFEEETPIRRLGQTIEQWLSK